MNEKIIKQLTRENLILIAIIIALLGVIGFLTYKTERGVFVKTCPDFNSEEAMLESFAEGNKALDGRDGDGKPCENSKYNTFKILKYNHGSNQNK